MALTSKIASYNSAWPLRFLADKPRIASAFGDELYAIHHVGSTAVPGLAAKPEIDMLIEVEAHRDAQTRDGVLLGLGYVRGSDLSDGHHFYRRNVDGVRTHKLHVCTRNHLAVIDMLKFRDLLRRDAALRQQYEVLKFQLESSNTGGMAEYLEKKAPFIRAALSGMPLALDQNKFDDSDKAFMSQALAHGRRALPACLPNPPVGCVIVREGRIVSFGFTQPPGDHHAEAMALSLLESGLDELTAYVTLEPCSFAGRTPSCALALVSAGVSRVHVAMLDPDPRNAGAGIEILRRAGIEVTVGLLGDEARCDLQLYLLESP